MKLQTRVMTVDPSDPQPEAIATAAGVIRGGGLVAFPTETVYGVGADAMNSTAIKKIFAAKGRPLDNPIIVHVAEPEQVAVLTDDVPELAARLMQKFWPGPLTLIFAKSAGVPYEVTAGQETVAVRMPRNSVALALIKASGVPVAAPSANISGRPSGTTGSHVYQDLAGKIDLVLDAGPVDIGLESTVLDISTQPPRILRPGVVTAEELHSVVGDVAFGRQDELLKRSPGTRYRHYSPRARVSLVKHQDRQTVARLIRDLTATGGRVGVVTRHPDLCPSYRNVVVRTMPGSLDDYARRMFAVIRELDADGVDDIIVEEVEEGGIGTAIMDRLRRAASHK